MNFLKPYLLINLSPQGWYAGCFPSNPIWTINLKQPGCLCRKECVQNFLNAYFNWQSPENYTKQYRGLCQFFPKDILDILHNGFFSTTLLNLLNTQSLCTIHFYFLVILEQFWKSTFENRKNVFYFTSQNFLVPEMFEF